MKKADEMFRELGYIRDFDFKHPLYDNGDAIIEVRWGPNCGRVAEKWRFMSGCGVQYLPWSSGEILACAQLIKEMGGRS